MEAKREAGVNPAWSRRRESEAKLEKPLNMLFGKGKPSDDA